MKLITGILERLMGVSFNQVGVVQPGQNATKGVRAQVQTGEHVTRRNSRRSRKPTITQSVPVYRVDWRRLERSKFAPWGVGDLVGGK